nr:cell surface protein SprA [Gemmatimonadaceae bacterium]
LAWDGERLFQAARFATEMQYQHLVFEEFARKIHPNIDPFVFNAVTDDIGLPNDRVDTLLVLDRAGGTGVRRETDVPLCSGAALRLQLLGDTRAACTARNTRLDEEDIDLDGQLNFSAAQVDRERFKRFVVDLGDRRQWTRVGRCFTRTDTTIAGTVDAGEQCWVQVRLNWRAPTDSQGVASDRRVRTLRLTMISGADARDDEFTQLALGRVRLSGAPWLKRSERPLAGIAGDSLNGRPGYVVASLIGTQDSTATLVYQSPPGVLDQTQQRQTGLENTRIQINERALRLQAGVPGGAFALYDRAEAFFRFPEGLKNFMGYRTLRLWARGRGNGWGPNGELDLFVRVGRDEHNFYLYRARANAGPTAAAWEPEVRIDLQRFYRLRALLQNAWLRQSADSLQCTGADLELIRRSAVPRGQFVQRYAACRDGYMVYTTDPASTPPNLAGVQELAVGFVRTDTVARSATAILPNDTLELWVNDVRLSDVVDDIGFAGEIGLTVQGGELFELRLGATRRDPNFRQLAESPTFLTQDGVDVSATVRLDKLLPKRWGLAMPLSVHWSGASTAPEFIDRTDIPAAGLAGLRQPRASGAQYALSIRRLGGAPPTSLVGAIASAMAVTATWGNGNSQSAFQRGRRSDYSVRAEWVLPGTSAGGAVLDTAGGDPFSGIAPIAPAARDSSGTLPSWLDGLLGRLPKALRESGAVRGLRDGAFNWRPQQFRISTQLGRTSQRTTSFLLPASSLLDAGRDVFGLDHTWRTTGVLEFRPAGALTARMDLDQAMDLRDYRGIAVPPGLSAPVDRGDVAWRERQRLLGLDVGLPRDRAVRSLFSFAPALTSWFTPRIDFSTSATVFRDPNGRSLLRTGDSTGAFRLPRRVGGSRALTLGAVLDPGRFLAALSGEQSAWRRVGKALLPIDLSFTRTYNANFDATPFDPGLGLQFGFAGLETYRQLDRRSSAQAGDTRRLAATSTLQLPLALSITGRVEQIDTDQWNRRALVNAQSLVEGRQRIVPDVTVRWNWRAKPSASFVQALGWNARWLVTRQTFLAPTEAAGFADQSASRVRSLPLSGSITWGTWLGGVTTNGSVNVARRQDERPGSLTSADSRDLSVDISRAFPLPGSWNFRSPLRTRIGWQQSETESIVAGLGLGAGTRAVLANTGRQVFNLNADADVGEQLTLSLTGSQVLNLDRAFNRRLSQTVLSAVLNLRFFSGDMR